MNSFGGTNLSFVMPNLVPGIHVFLARRQGVDGRDKPGHDEKTESAGHGTIEIGEKSTNQLFGCTKPLIFGLKARGATSWAT